MSIYKSIFWHLQAVVEQNDNFSSLNLQLPLLNNMNHLMRG